MSVTMFVEVGPGWNRSHHKLQINKKKDKDTEKP